MTAESIAKALRGRKVGGQWMALCPAHDDRNPSLALRDDGGKVLAKCHAGCAQDAVIEALKERGLWESERGQSFEDRIVCAYSYTDENASLLYEVVRFRDPKEFRPRYLDGHGNWIWRKHPRQVLYRLAEVLESPIIFLVEGEKDCETLRSHGFVATCEAGGANAPWLPSFTQSLAGREVILVPDADTPGRQRALRIARALLGHAARIIVFEPAGAKDMSDWFDLGHSELELIAHIDDKLVNQ
jgi:DNA primase